MHLLTSPYDWNKMDVASGRPLSVLPFFKHAWNRIFLVFLKFFALTTFNPLAASQFHIHAMCPILNIKSLPNFYLAVCLLLYLLGHNILSWWFSGFTFTFTVNTIMITRPQSTILKLDWNFLLSINPVNNGFSCILSKFWILHHMHPITQTSPYWLHWAHTRQLAQTRQPSLATQPDQQTITANPTLIWANGEI